MNQETPQGFHSQICTQMATYVSAGHIQYYAINNYHMTLKSPSDPLEELGTLSPHCMDFSGPHFMVVDKKSIAKLAVGNFPPLTGMVVTHWPVELLKNSPSLPPWWLKAVKPLTNLIIRFCNVPMTATIFEGLVTNSPFLKSLTMEVDLFSVDLFPSCTDNRHSSANTKFSKVFGNLKFLTIINLNSFFGTRTISTSCMLFKIWNNNITRLQQWTSGVLEGLTLRNAEDGSSFFDSSFTDECILPFILNNLATLKYLDLNNSLLLPRHLKRIMRNKKFKQLKLNSLIIDVRFESCVPTEDDCTGVVGLKPIESNLEDVLRFIKTQANLTSLFLRIDFWNKTGIQRILKRVPHLEKLFIQQVESRLEIISQRNERIELSSIFSSFPSSLKMVKFSTDLPRPLVDPTQLRNMQVFRAFSIQPEFFKTLPVDLVSFFAVNAVFISSACFDELIHRCEKLTSLSIKGNEDVVGNDSFRKIVEGLPLLKYLEVSESIVSDHGLIDHGISEDDNAFDEETHPSSILNSLKFLEELKLVYFPYVTPKGFLSIRNPSLRRMDVSQNVSVNAQVLDGLTRMNPLLDNIVVNRCPNINTASILEIIKSLITHGRDVGFEIDMAYVGMSSCMKQANHDLSDKSDSGKANVLEDLTRLFQLNNLSIPTYVEYTAQDRTMEVEEDADGFHEMLKRMRIKEDSLGETLLTTLSQPIAKAQQEMLNRCTIGGFSQVIKSFIQNSSIALSSRSPKEIDVLYKIRSSRRKLPLGYQYPETISSGQDNLIFGNGDLKTSTNCATFPTKGFSSTVAPVPKIGSTFSADSAIHHVRSSYAWAAPCFDPATIIPPLPEPKSGTRLNHRRSKSI